MARGLILAGAGIALGVAIALLGRRWIAGELYEIPATDPLVFVGVPLALGMVAVVAVGVPALRATRLDLANTLRTER
jgi:putative ABC transport system permease protein